MAHCSDIIKPLKQYAPVSMADAPGNVTPTWTFTDNTVNVYPRGRNGKSMKVTIVRYQLTRSTPVNSVNFHICRNCGKWGFRIDYKHRTKRVSIRELHAEMRRMGATEEHVALMTPVG